MENVPEIKQNVKCPKKEGILTVLSVLQNRLPNTIMVCIAVSKLHSLHYPADDANVLQTHIFCSILARGKTYSCKLQSCHMPDIF